MISMRMREVDRLVNLAMMLPFLQRNSAPIELHFGLLNTQHFADGKLIPCWGRNGMCFASLGDGTSADLRQPKGNEHAISVCTVVSNYNDILDVHDAATSRSEGREKPV